MLSKGTKLLFFNVHCGTLRFNISHWHLPFIQRCSERGRKYQTACVFLFAKLRIILIRKAKRLGHFAFLKIAAMGYDS
jgi:hypothetical protein